MKNTHNPISTWTLFGMITTLGNAAWFNPLQIRVQDFKDRRYYRQKYNAEQALAQFTAAAWTWLGSPPIIWAWWKRQLSQSEFVSG